MRRCATAPLRAGRSAVRSALHGFLAVTMLVVLTAGCQSEAQPPGRTAQPASTQPTSETASPSSTTSPAPNGPAPLPAASDVSILSVKINSIGLTTSHPEKLALMDNGELAAPRDPDRVGWYSGGTLPGEVGPAVIAGHVDSKTGPAVFYELGKVKANDTIKITLSDHRVVTFVVDRVITTAKKGFPTDQVFGPTPDAELRLITCGGPYDRTVQSYLDNTIVFATRR